MAGGKRPKAGGAHRHVRAARRAAPAEKIKPETQSAEQTEIPAQGARVTARRLGSIKTNTLIWRQSCRRDGSTPARTGWRSHMQLNAFFPSLDIGNDPAKIRDWAQAAEDLGYANIEGPEHVFGTTARGGWGAPLQQKGS